jgi:S1-C subfamily serine protease
MPKHGDWNSADAIKGAHLVRTLPLDGAKVHLELVQVKQVTFMKGHDIALIHAASNKPIEGQLALSSTLPKIGDEVACYACPNVEGNIDNLEGTIHIDHQDFAGVITEYYPNGRDRVMLPGPCFQVEMEGPGGTSGGPVFNAKGNVVGVISASMGGIPPVTFFTPVMPMLDMLTEFETDRGKQKLSLRNLSELGFVTIVA